MCAKFRCAALRIKKALGIFGELVTTMSDSYIQLLQPPDNRPILLVRRSRSLLSHLLFVILFYCGNLQRHFLNIGGGG